MTVRVNFVLKGAWVCVMLLAGGVAWTGGEERAVSRGKPTVEEARKFIDEVNSRMLELTTESNRAEWVKSTYITDDTEILAAHADRQMIDTNVQYAKQATRFDHLSLPPDLARELKILKLSARPGEVPRC